MRTRSIYWITSHTDSEKTPMPDPFATRAVLLWSEAITASLLVERSRIRDNIRDFAGEASKCDGLRCRRCPGRSRTYTNPALWCRPDSGTETYITNAVPRIPSTSSRGNM
ncbi:hypothetical protein OH77DRAFT_933411 [Trametes cingulata]|nr:hypothetical protein OH77DRAFT_933411 [Trametes cingulata]